MSSELKLTNIKHASSSSNNLVLGSDGSATIANGTLSAGTLGSSVVFPAGGTGNSISIAYLYDEKSSGTSGGSSSTGWNTRHLNTKSDPDSFVTLNTSTFKFTLGAGTYLIHWSAPAFQSNSHQSGLYDDTAGSHLSSGTSLYSSSSNAVSNASFGYCDHTITSNNTYYIRHHFQTAITTNGLGVANASGVAEIYTYVVIYKIK
jgi:hypothetical protein